jgi:glyoxylase-like metal-dependent hydrolase (beta-lactamase superfamily II)
VIFETLTVGGLETNCYLLADEPPGALVIDPGGGASVIISRLESEGLEPVLIVNTHGHADHIAANAALRKRYPDAKIAVGRLDAKALTSILRNMSVFVARPVRSPRADRLLDDGDVVEFARWRFRVLHTPGHTPGGVCLFTEDLDGRPALFAGDTLFSGGVGRCDIPGGNWDSLVESIRHRIFTLPDETVVYPGHGPSTTVAEEKRSNPFVKP